MRVNSLLAPLVRGAFPHYCLFCGLRSGRDLPLCAACEAELPSNSSACGRCALPLPASPGAAEGLLCGACLHAPPPFATSTVPWIYDAWFAHIIQRWKFAGEQGLTGLLASLWLRGCGAPASVDLLVPVPLNWRKQWRRGFNQAELLARCLVKAKPALGRVETGLIKRRLDTPAQSAMRADQRARNLSGAFTARRRCDNLRVAIVDDVLTTGATASALTRALLAAGAAQVDVWCIARTPPPGR